MIYANIVGRIYFNGKTRRQAVDELIKETTRIQAEIESHKMTHHLLSCLGPSIIINADEPTRLFNAGAISAGTWIRLIENGGV